MTVARVEPGTGTSKLARAFPSVTGLVGLLVAVAAAMHTVLSIRKAHLQRGGYDSRLSDALDRVDELRTRCDHGARRESAAKEVGHSLLVVHWR